jgi:hypothetical protein
MMRARLTLILGIHRSGTSLLTQGLAAMGAGLGVFEDTRDPDNPDGYAEHPQIRQFNDRLLAHLGASWDNWGFRASLVDWDAADLQLWRDQAVTLLQELFTGSGPFALKDPRVATLAPFWEQVVPLAGFDLRRILILRDPAEVAESQVQRVARRPHEFPVIATPEPMAALWLVGMQDLLAALSDDATLLVSHAQLMADPVPVLAAIAPFAGLSPDDSVIAEFARDRVKPALHRARMIQAPAGPWMDAARALFRTCATDQSPRPLPRIAARAILDQHSAAFAPLMAGLGAVRDSIARMQHSQMLRQQAVTEISRFVWMLAPLTTFAPPAQLSKALLQAETLAQETALLRSSFAFGHSVGQLYLSAGQLEAAGAWLDQLRPQFGHVPAFAGLEQKLAQKRAEVATRTKD